ncbi:TonB-dependent receptor [Tunicatimonas pelagia]|uniref:TonB-dependent receptor n=1 Tax=Tunicatimonas pelagia TaxID=931531 RepID=UPI002665D719|nr:TonB-dependent receptor [Tunicatimonas pelagia]WKN41811.1 TonB-dependent receptor [Tunicatimonas pelagia]
MRILATFLLVGCLFSVSAWAQTTVYGMVTDASSGEPLVGANVQILATQQGATTDLQGKYQLELATDTATLRISYVGYRVREVKITGSGEIQRSVSLSPSTSLEEVVIQAIRADRQAPVTQTTVERETIEQQYVGQDALFVLEETTPSILTYSESGTRLTNYGQMRLRGIDQTRINITLNGVPLNDMIDQGVFFSNFTDFGNSISSVQVQRGVGTTTNGTASYAGSINFESVNLDDSVTSAEIQLTGGSFNTWRASGEVKTGKLANNMAFYTRFSRTTSDGYRNHTGSDSYSFFFSGGYFGDKDLIKLTAFTGRSQNELAYLAVALPDIERDPKRNYVSENDIDDFGQQFIQLQYTRIISPRTSSVSSIYYGGAGGDFPATFPDGNGNLSQTNFPLFNDHYGFMTYLNHTSYNGQFNLNGGLHAYTFQRENIEAVVPNISEPYYQDQSRKNELSLFGKVDYEWNQLMLFADLQLRTVSLSLTPDEVFLGQSASIPDRSWTFLNPKVGVTYRFTSLIDAYASFGRSGREPTRFDILGSTVIRASNLASVQDENSVQAEYVNDFEAGVRIHRGKLVGQANLFYMQFENEIAPIGELIPEGFVQLRKNVPSSYRRGIELDGKYVPTAKWTITGNLTYMQSNIDKFAPEGGDQVFRDVEPAISPEWLMNASVGHKFTDWLSATVSGRYVGESFLEPTNQPDLILPSFFVMDAQLTAKFRKHELSIHANNLFDTEYYSFGQPVQYEGQTVPGYFVQPPRHVYAILRLRF